MSNVIDFHIHYSPEILLREKLALLKSPDDRLTRYVQGIPASTIHNLLHQLDRHLAVMDYAGVDRVVLSSAEGMRGTLASCRVVNDHMHEAMQRYPDRVLGMAHTDPLAGPEGLDELDRAVRQLGLKGVAVTSTVGGKGLDNPDLWPFYQKVQDLGTFLFVHPALATPSLGYQGFDAFDLYRTVGREFDLVLGTIRLIAGGVLDDFPDLKIIISHLAGGISALMGRIKNFQDKEFWGLTDDPVHGRAAKKPFASYIPRLFFDTGGHFGDMTTLRAALLNIPSSQILFGTDYPQEIRDAEEIHTFIGDIRAMNDLAPKEREGILGANGLGLID